MEQANDKDYPFLLMSVGTAHELWVWLVSAASERQQELAFRVAGHGAGGDGRLRWEERFVRRLLCAFEYYVQNGPADASTWNWMWWDGLARRGVDEIGLALFSRYLVQQAEYWGAPARGHVEASVGPIISAFSALFHERLGRSPDEVRRRADELFLDEDARTARTHEVEWRGFMIQREEEGFLTYEEDEERRTLAHAIHEQLEKAKEAGHA
jgi:hypothetical protein